MRPPSRACGRVPVWVCVHASSMSMNGSAVHCIAPDAQSEGRSDAADREAVSAMLIPIPRPSSSSLSFSSLSPYRTHLCLVGGCAECGLVRGGCRAVCHCVCRLSVSSLLCCLCLSVARRCGQSGANPVPVPVTVPANSSKSSLAGWLAGWPWPSDDNDGTDDDIAKDGQATMLQCNEGDSD